MEEQVNVRYVFMMLMAIADPKGYVVGTDVALARRINIPLGEFRHCVEMLGRPDPDSNSKMHEGRRVLESDGERGYFIVNFVKYRDLKDEEHRREYMKEYMRKYREAKQGVNSGKRKVTQEAVAEPVHVEREPEPEDVNRMLSEAARPIPRALPSNTPPIYNTPEVLEAWLKFMEHLNETGVKTSAHQRAEWMQEFMHLNLSPKRVVEVLIGSMKNGAKKPWPDFDSRPSGNGKAKPSEPQYETVAEMRDRNAREDKEREERAKRSAGPA